MKVIESNEKHFCDNCYTYGYTWDIYTDKLVDDAVAEISKYSDFLSKDSAAPEDECYPQMSLCKKCLVKLFKAIEDRRYRN